MHSDTDNGDGGRSKFRRGGQKVGILPAFRIRQQDIKAVANIQVHTDLFKGDSADFGN